jgi:hypothetical protein
VGPWRRWAVVLLVAAVGVSASTVVARGGGAGPPIDEKQTPCWGCHKDWPAEKLPTFFTLLPPAEAGAAVGEPFQYIVQVQNPWRHDIVFVEPALDISGAPSLQFAGGPDPIVAKPLSGNIPISPTPNPGNPNNPFGSPSGKVTFEAPIGVTTLSADLVPADASATGPKLHMRAFTGTEATGTPAKDCGAAPSPGATVHCDLPLQGGNWTIEARADSFQDLGAPTSGGSVPFVVKYTARVDIQGTLLKLPQTVDVAKHSSSLVIFGLKATKEPGAGEAVKLWMNATEHYAHKEAANPDFANTTKAGPAPLAVTSKDGRVVITAPAGTTSFGVAAPRNGATMGTISEAVGYASALLLVSSVWTGGMFGKASRRQLNGVFGTAKRRVAFHNFLSYGILLAASIHTVLFIIETGYYWTVGVIWGGLAILSMFGLGLTGAFQVGMIRRWNYAVWRWSHYGLAVAAIVFTLAHMGLDGAHFSAVQNFFHWKDPLDPRHLA